MRIGPLEIAILVAVAVVLLYLLIGRRNRNALESPSWAEDIAPAPLAPGERNVAWAYGVLYEAGVDADADPAYATKILLDADPHLSDAAAKSLVQRIVNGA